MSKLRDDVGVLVSSKARAELEIWIYGQREDALRHSNACHAGNLELEAAEWRGVERAYRTVRDHLDRLLDEAPVASVEEVQS